VIARRRGATGLLLTLSLVGPPARAQGSPEAALRPQRAAATATLHQAWLAEVLDLDTQRAVALYAEVAQRGGPVNLERWVAVARLIELQRLGIDAGRPIDLGEVPTPLRAPFAAAQTPLDKAELARFIAADPKTLLPILGTAEGKVPLLRPIVPVAEDWLLKETGPSQRDRLRQRREAFANRVRFTDPINAYQILVAEVAGDRRRADANRKLFFPSWTPPPVSTDHAVNLERFHRNLEDLRNEREGTRSQDGLLQRLRSTVEKTYEADPAAAIGLLLRLPLYAERLLKETSNQGR